MNACPEAETLLRFLEGELGGEQDARIVVHVEACGGCQARLERLTRGRPAPGDESTVEATREEPGPDPRTADARGETADVATGDDTDDAGRVDLTVDRDSDRTVPRIQDDGPATRDHVIEGPAHDPTIPGYEILQRLGEGGMGVVYKARHLGLNRLVALKMIRGGSQARRDFFKRFRVEAQSVARLRHPNILQIYDIGEAGGLPFVALELLDGGSLVDRLAGNPQPGRPAADLMITLARAVHVAHEAGIIHRDLKPGNILYTSDGVPKITDFGLAKRVDSDAGHTESGAIMGSPSYMAPEQARGESRKVGPAADIYALGAILYEMLTGRPPFKGETPIETVRLVIDDDPVTPSRLVPRVPRDLETICLKCLHKEPSRRYASARALADDLERYLVGEPIAARRTPTWERAAKWARRRPLAAVAAAALLLAFAGAIAALFGYQESRLRRSQQIVAFLDQGSRLEGEADAARSHDELTGAQLHISGFLPRLEALKDDPRVESLSGRLERKRQDLGLRLATYQSQQSERERLAADRGRFERFRALHDEAIFHDTRFTGLDLPGNEDATRRAAEAALDVYAAPGAGDSWALGSRPESLSPPEQAEIAEGCYELLLVLSRAETTPERGLLRLDQAARLHPAPTRAYHSRRAACLERAGDAGAVERERRAAATLAPSTAFDHYLAGQECYERNEPIAAIRHFDRALQQQPDHFWAQCLSAICWLRLRSPEAARAGFNACLKREPRFAWLYILRGLAWSLGPEHAPPEEIRLRSDAAEVDYGRALERLERKPSAELRYVLLVNRGLLRSRRGDRDAAAADLKAAIELGDHQALASSALADLYRQQGRYDEAIDLFGRAIERRPDWAPLYRGRADVVLTSQETTPARRVQALSDLERAIRLEHPDNPVLARDHTNCARLLGAEGRLADALAACDAAIERSRDYPEAHRLRLDVLLKLKRHDDVIRSCDPMIARGRASSAIYERRGLAREEIRDFPGAIEDFTSAMALGGDRTKLLRRRGWAYIIADAPQLALHDFQDAIRLDPSSADAHNGRGLARLRLAQHREGVADAQRALSLGEPTPDLFYKAARVYALAAIVVAAEARKTGPESVLLVSQYQDRAVDLLRGAIRMLPADRRSWFVNEVILRDPDLRTLRRRLSSMDLAGFVRPRTTTAAAPGQ